MKNLYSFILICFVALSGFATEHNGKYTKQKNAKKTVIVNSDATVDIDNKYGNVFVTTWDEDKIEIDVVITVSGDSESWVDKKLASISIEFGGTKSLYSAKTIFGNVSSSGRRTSMEVNYTVKIPKNGKVILAMNHPLGGMDAIALISALQNHRKDIKFIVNDLLMNLTHLADLFVGVNKHGKNEKSTRQQIVDLFASDQLVCIFPAGLVSRRSKGKIRDLTWKKTFVTYAAKYDQPVIPVFIDGELSPFFYRLSRIRKFLRIKLNLEMLYLSDEMFKQRNKTIRFIIGKPLYIKDMPEVSEREQAQLVKAKVYELADDNQ